MTPDLSVVDVGYMRLADAELRSDGAVGAPCVYQSPDRADIFVRQFRLAMALAFGASFWHPSMPMAVSRLCAALTARVLIICRRITKKQVSRIAAGGRVARVTYVSAIRNVAMLKLPRVSVGVHRDAVARVEHSVAPSRFPCMPQPARLCLRHLRPEASHQIVVTCGSGALS